MELKKSMMLVMMGIGGTLMYQQIMNGNAKKMMKDMKRTMRSVASCVADDLEDMM